MNIKVEKKVTSSQTIYKEGIVANNDIMTYDEFYSFMKPMLNEELINKILIRFQRIRALLQRDEIKKAYNMWENFQRDILNNKNYNVSLLFIENINTEASNYKFKYASKEYDVLSNRGKLTRMKQLSEQLFKASIEEQIAEHLQEFLGHVATRKLSWKLIQQAFNLNDHDINTNATDARWHTGDWTYKNILYGSNPVWQGNAADAFMNHMAHLHAQVLAAQISNENIQLFTTSVFNEEKDNIFQLLYNSKNTTAWYTGGDIVLKFGGQIYNIQLKTGQQTNTRRRRIGGKLAKISLINFINDIEYDLKNTNVDKIIKKLYNELQTSGYIELTNKAANEVLDQCISKLT